MAQLSSQKTMSDHQKKEDVASSEITLAPSELTLAPFEFSLDSTPPHTQEICSPSFWTLPYVLMLVGTLITHMVGAGWMTSAAFFVDRYYETNTLDDYTYPFFLGYLSSTGIALLFSTAWPTWHLCGIINPTWIIGVGSVTHFLGVVGFAFSTAYWSVILTQAIVAPLGASLMIHATTVVLTQWFQHTELPCLPIAIPALGSGIGGIIYPIVIAHIPSTYGLGNPVHALVLVLGLALLFTIFAVRLPKDSTAREPKRRATRAYRRVIGLDWFFAAHAFGAASFVGGAATLMAYVGHIARARGVEQPWIVLAIAGGVSMFGRAIPALVRQLAGRCTALVVTTGISGIATLAIAFTNAGGLASMVPFAVFWSIGFGAFLSLVSHIGTHVAPAERPQLRVGLTYSLMVLPSLTCPSLVWMTEDSYLATPLAGIVEDSDLVRPLSISATMQLIGCVMFIGARLALPKPVNGNERVLGTGGYDTSEA